MATENIRARRSQLLNTYGVGSLFPAENASFLISGLHLWDEDKLPRVVEPRLARQLHAGALMAPPATPEKRIAPNVPVTRFPRVLQCPECSALGSIRQLRASNKEPECGLCGVGAQLLPSRFVAACGHGHLEDFPYFEWVHGYEIRRPEGWQENYPEGHPEKASGGRHVLRLLSQGRTSSLGDLRVVCSCKKSRSLDGAFGKNGLARFKCKGERPWLGQDCREKGCDKPLKTLQRGASNVWFAAVASSISIPPYSGRMSEIASREARYLDGLTRESLESSASSGKGDILEAVVRQYPGATDVVSLAKYLLDVRFAAGQEALSEEEFRFEEYKALITGAADDSSQFVSLRTPVAEELSTWIESVRRVSRLREVRALRGFTRLTAAEQLPDANLAPLRPEQDEETWLPAVEMLGEGLFISLDPKRLETWAMTALPRERRIQLQKNADKAVARYNEPRPDEQKMKAPVINIVKVVVHTLAHVLIDQLSLDAGYPASSLRERLFVGEGMAAVLIYTASSDSAGSLGGVASMAEADRLAPALEEAEARLKWCSADPVCVESSGNGTNGANLAACHNCVLLPETSCEEFNTGLDRGVLFGTPENPDGGLIDWLREHPRDPVVSDSGLEGAWVDVLIQVQHLAPVVEQLGQQQVAVPQVDEEIGAAGVIVDLLWPEAQVVLVRDLGDGTMAELEDEGWKVISYNDADEPGDVVDEVLDALS